MTDTLLFDAQDGVATITLNRPEKRNAFDDDMLAAFVARLDQCDGDDAIRAVIVTGAGKAFSSGGDVGGFKQRSEATPAQVKRRLVERTQALPRRLARMEKPLIAAINGSAYGGGLDIALACDIRVAAESARMAETYARMGLAPGAGGAWFLPRIVGVSKALEMFWTSEVLSAQDALRLGLVSQVFPDDQFMAKTVELARRIADAAPLSVRTIKKLVYQGLDMQLEQALDMVASNMPIVRLSEDHQEAVAAFKEKRPARFKGR